MRMASGGWRSGPSARVAVAPVAFNQFLHFTFEGRGLAACEQLPVAPFRADAHVRGYVELDWCIWKDNRPLVATLADNIEA